APGGAEVTVSLGQAQVQAVADATGAWRAHLPPMPAGGPYVLTARSGGSTQTLSDIMVGDVWLCSGQSNMELPVERTLNAPSVIGAANDDGIRLVTVQKDFDVAAQDTFRNPLAWAAASPASVGGFSAACYYFAQDLRRDHDVPTGLISSNWGGSNIETWMSPKALA
ncbi:hypothetical protein LTR94_032803, partial [Friedmanniomyces endolithicus]